MISFPSPSFNDLIGLEYDWKSEPSESTGKTNCFALCMEARKRLGLRDFTEEYRHLYKETMDGEIGVRQILKLIKSHTERIYRSRPGALFYRSSPNRHVAMAVVIDEQDCLILSPGKRVIRLPFATVTKGKYYWAE